MRSETPSRRRYLLDQTRNSITAAEFGSAARTDRYVCVGQCRVRNQVR